LKIMRLKILILFAAITFAACNAVDSNVQVNRAASVPLNSAATPTPVAPTHVAQAEGEVKRVTGADLEKLLKEGKAVVVDVRSQAMYDAGHITGARLIPLPDVDKRANELPRDKTIVTYCS
jgi:3-mercaptopyruvate sulfurtransferase SseA